MLKNASQSLHLPAWVLGGVPPLAALLMFIERFPPAPVLADFFPIRLFGLLSGLALGSLALQLIQIDKTRPYFLFNLLAATICAVVGYAALVSYLSAAKDVENHYALTEVLFFVVNALEALLAVYALPAIRSVGALARGNKSAEENSGS